MNTTSTICGKCHRPLTDPKSVERGFGPDCWERIKAEEAREEAAKEAALAEAAGDDTPNH